MKEIDITEREAGQRLDKFLRKYMSLASGSFFYKMLRKKNIVLNGKKAAGSERLKEGDRLTLYLSEETIRKMTGLSPLLSWPQAETRQGAKTAGTGIKIEIMAGTGKKAPFSLIYEDQDILVLNKPQGMLTQKADPQDLSLNDHMIRWLLSAGKITKEQFCLQKPSVCSRLDRNTSGIVLAGLSLKGLQGLSRILRERTGIKLYYALVWGHIDSPRHLKGYLIKDRESNRVKILPYESSGGKILKTTGKNCEKNDKKNSEKIRGPKTEDPPRYIETAWRPLRYGGGCTLLEIRLITGRSHQIRAHLGAEGHFIIGDQKYGNPEINREFSARYGLKGQLLHSGVFIMPEEHCPFPHLAGRRFTAPLEPCFIRTLDSLGIVWDAGEWEWPAGRPEKDG